MKLKDGVQFWWKSKYCRFQQIYVGKYCRKHHSLKNPQQFFLSCHFRQSTGLPTLFLPYTNSLPDDVICNVCYLRWCYFTLSVIRHFICGINWSWLLNLNLAYKSDNSGAIDVKTDGSVPEEKFFWRILGPLSFLNWIGTFTLSLLLKPPP